jgi:hypothetical protein
MKCGITPFEPSLRVVSKRVPTSQHSTMEHQLCRPSFQRLVKRKQGLPASDLVRKSITCQNDAPASQNARLSRLSLDDPRLNFTFCVISSFAGATTEAVYPSWRLIWPNARQERFRSWAACPGRSEGLASPFLAS